MFILKSEFSPTGDQPQAIKGLLESLRAGNKFQTLKGATGTGKTYTIACVIEQYQKPTLVLTHNKTLAAQWCNELRQLFPYNAVEYFISYYDYYQPEAYIPVTDTYIEKTASINDEIEMLRHSATRSLFERRDVIVVASISCIYGLGMPVEYLKAAISLRVSQEYNPRQLIRDLVNIQYRRSDSEFSRATFRLLGDVLEIVPAYDDRILRVEFFGDEIDAISILNPLTGRVEIQLDRVNIYPASHFVTPEAQLQRAILAIEEELEERLQQLEKQGKFVEADRLKKRTKYDLEMLKNTGYCNGIENYSRHLAGRKPGQPPDCLVDYFPEDWLLVIDESHVTVPQIRAMYNGDRSRKEVLIEHGFRLPSALDNRPLKAEEFWQKVNQCIFVSATPGDWELEQSGNNIFEQIIRPTGILDPEIVVRPTKGQIDDLLAEITERVKRKERVLVTTLTKRMAEDLTSYLQEKGVNVQYLHSEIQSLERIEILQGLRNGDFDVIVGVNLLREGLDLPEVSLVAILDADKEGFLRSEKSLIQTIGRAARNVNGKAILYADNITESMEKAINETNRRRLLQMEYNRQHNITPKAIQKKCGNSILEFLEISRQLNKEKHSTMPEEDFETIGLDKIPELIGKLEEKMKKAASQLEFEKAAEYRDKIIRLRERLKGN
ncbi:MAG: excinuclease ABC subunit UvrB [Geminocystis sp.]|nr:excinuclease ABC subunit UvrB [Geminocystis sp.]HIK37140.1 excinuclease ABC subunit UvrB [Geminocystis sp. M7585_C2015_104]MCS7147490.1 excinuclease ABC subunit UvrB [Geminocystis sp.]MCX8077893.1 excinuclease ABC subunit UvrB [Geminocystis sp.]MDW8115183.1 excinuclease ABC subunit UvrB [Geminocystis sp.]